MKNIFIYVVSIFMFLGCELENKDLIDLLNKNQSNIEEIDQTTNKKSIDTTIKKVKYKEIKSITSSKNSKEEDSDKTDNENTTEGTENSNINSEEVLRREFVNSKEVKPSNWYVRVVVEEAFDGMKTKSAQLGQIDKDDATTTYSLRSILPYGKSYLDVVFKNPDGLKNGDYKTSFHMYQPEQEDRWTFTVNTDVSHANSDFLLHISGIFVLTPYIDEYNRLRYKERKSVSNPLLKNMKLIDKVSSKEMAVVKDGKTQIYKFNMSGNLSREFELVLQVDEVSVASKKSKVKVMKSARKSFIKKDDTFDLFHPPIIEDIK